MFEEPTGFPPARKFDHKIPLKLFFFFQKREIKRLVKKILSNGIIQQNMSHFTSHVLLVKKRIIHGVYMWIIGNLIK
jgi:hypothetical protein